MSCTTEQLMAENKKLKEEIKKLKAQHQIDMEEEKNHIYMNEMMPLEAQVEDYEEMTEALAEYFSKIDQKACDVFNKLLPTWAGCRAEMD